MNQETNKLIGIVIDPGHGGKDGGASGNGLLEKDLTLSISKYMYDRFKSLGLPVFITREADIDLDKNARPKRILSAFGNDPNVIVISNHINAGGGEGAEVIYSVRNNSVLSEKILNNLAQSGQKIRKYYQKRLPNNLSKDYYYVLRETPNTEAIIVEYGFIDNAEDAKRIKNNYKDYAEAVVKAVLDYKNIKYTEEIKDSYTVKVGDTLWTIAKKYGLTVQELKDINNISGNLLTVGQVLKLDNNYNEEKEYIVKKGDTLYSISKKYNLPVENIKLFNNLKSDILTPGQILYLYSDEINTNDNIHLVQKGDTLYSISKLYNISIDKIKKLNNLNSDILNVGQKLIIKDKPEEKIYTVQKGDTLYKIAMDNNTTIKSLQNLNNLKDINIYIGQKLLLP